MCIRDSSYGDTTVAAVKAFQKKYNLTADGVAGSETLKKLDSAYKNADSNTSTDDDSLRKGATGTAVKTLQTNLKKLGFYTAYVDGSFGSTTESAVKAFQKKYGLTADGVAGSATLKKIESAVASASSGKITTEQVKKLMAAIIEEEDKKKPLSDRVITERLVERGVKICRRTVAKYREEMGVKDASGRKSFQ